MFHPANDTAMIRIRLTTRLLYAVFSFLPSIFHHSSHIYISYNSGKNRYHISGEIDRNFMLRQIIRREFDE